MATLPTDADSTPNYTPAQHATHHNTLHGLWNKLTTKGDLLVATAAQAYSRLAVGTNGQVLTADSTVTEGVKWATPSGSSVPTPDDIPALPNAADYEFNATSSSLPSGWSWVNQGSSTYQEAQGVGQIRCASGAGAGNQDVKALVETLPAASGWVAKAKLSIAAPASVGSAWPNIGIVLRDSGTGKMTFFMLNALAAGGLIVDNLSSPTGWSNRPGAGFAPWTIQTPFYLAVQKNTGATTYNFDYSTDGANWVRTHTALDISSHMTPNQLGFAVDCRGSSIVGGACHWFRVT